MLLRHGEFGYSQFMRGGVNSQVVSTCKFTPPTPLQRRAPKAEEQRTQVLLHTPHT